MKRIAGTLMMVFGVALGAYISLWVLFANPIMDVYSAHATGTLSATIIAFSTIKIIFAIPVGITIAYIGVSTGRYLREE